MITLRQRRPADGVRRVKRPVPSRPPAIGAARERFLAWYERERRKWDRWRAWCVLVVLLVRQRMGLERPVGRRLLASAAGAHAWAGAFGPAYAGERVMLRVIREMAAAGVVCADRWRVWLPAKQESRESNPSGSMAGKLGSVMVCALDSAA